MATGSSLRWSFFHKGCANNWVRFWTCRTGKTRYVGKDGLYNIRTNPTGVRTEHLIHVYGIQWKGFGTSLELGAGLGSMKSALGPAPGRPPHHLTWVGLWRCCYSRNAKKVVLRSVCSQISYNDCATYTTESMECSHPDYRPKRNGAANYFCFGPALQCTSHSHIWHKVKGVLKNVT